MKKRYFLYLIVVLSLVSLASSVYLVDNHLRESDKPAACDLSKTVSCSTVITSEYSKFLNVPVSAFGIVWALVLGMLAIMALKKKSHLKVLVLWSFLGVVTALYFIWAEIQLGAICPFCTIIHVSTFLSFGFSLFMVRNQWQNFQFKDFIKSATPWLLIGSIFVTITIMYFNL